MLSYLSLSLLDYKTSFAEMECFSELWGGGGYSRRNLDLPLWIPFGVVGHLVIRSGSEYLPLFEALY